MDIVISDVAKDLIINIINIIVLFIIVKSLAYKPVKKFLDDRKLKIEKIENDALQKEQHARESVEKYEKLLEDSKKESNRIIAEAEIKAKAQAKEIIDDARLKSKELMQIAHRDIEEERNKTQREMQNEITEIAFKISEKILLREISDKDNFKIASDFFDEKSNT